uniref:SEA domain-containing protein n=1 Tax=Lepisosteus oculatus TaxID=7918 RepID=W5MHZ9_LEPOC
MFFLTKVDNTTSTTTAPATTVSPTTTPSSPASTATGSTSTAASTATTSSTTSTTPPSTTVVVEVTAPLRFSIMQTFIASLADTNSSVFQNFASGVTDQVNKVYKKKYTTFLRSRVRKFSRGSIVADMDLVFRNTSPSATDIVNTMKDAIANSEVIMPIDVNSIISSNNPPSSAPALRTSLSSLLALALATVLVVLTQWLH